MKARNAAPLYLPPDGKIPERIDEDNLPTELWIDRNHVI